MDISKIKSMVRYARWKTKKTLATFLFSRCSIHKNKIIFDNFLGKSYGDNPKYITEELLKRNLNYDIVWVLKNENANVPKGVRTVKYGSFKALYEYATAHFWVDNVRNNIRTKKKKGQIYLQTWHGGFGAKPVEGMVENKLSKEYIKQAKQDGVETDAIIVCCEAQEKIFKEFFWLNKDTEYLRIGLPRNDVLFQIENQLENNKKVIKELDIDKDSYIVLYAPTFRDDGSTDGYLHDLDTICVAFEKRMNKKCTIIIRMHPNAENLAHIYKYNRYIINGTHYPDSQKLCILADSVITDYSSIADDSAIIRKFVLLYVSDIDNYRKNRGVLKEFNESALPKAYDEEQLVKYINELNEAEYNRLLNRYLSENPIYDNGKAAKSAVDWIISYNTEKQ